MLLGALIFEPPVRTDAMLTLLDFLCHDFPKVHPCPCCFSVRFGTGLPVIPDLVCRCLTAAVQVRKVTAEKLYIRVLTLEDKFPGGAVDVLLNVLSQTPWAGPVAPCVTARDSLYSAIGLGEPPAARLGVGAVDRVFDDAAAAGAGGGDASRDPGAAGGRGDGTFDSYESLVKETGY